LALSNADASSASPAEATITDMPDDSAWMDALRVEGGGGGGGGRGRMSVSDSRIGYRYRYRVCGMY
jgi:hypothetical protein